MRDLLRVTASIKSTHQSTLFRRFLGSFLQEQEFRSKRERYSLGADLKEVEDLRLDQ
jgi:hypothetical protein